MSASLIQAELSKMCEKMHPNCIVCHSSNKRCLGLKFTLTTDGSVEACFNCDKSYEGYENYLHGGIISALLDGAMTNCMFAHGYAVVTAALNIRFRHPVIVGKVAVVRAQIIRSSSVLHVLTGEIEQDNKVKATAVGKFMERSQLGFPKATDRKGS